MKDVDFLREALGEAKKAFEFGEVPVGAVIVRNGEIIARGFNRKEAFRDPTAHAEIVAIREAVKKLNTWRLLDCTLYCTVEPCVMCCGAIIQSRIPEVVYSVPDPKFGGVESLYRILEDPRGNHRVRVRKVYLKEAEQILKDFFKRLRERCRSLA